MYHRRHGSAFVRSPIVTFYTQIPRRLDKFLRDATPLGLTEIRKAIADGRVRVDGSPERAAPRLVFDGDHVVVDGRAVLPRAAHPVLVLNKPRHVTATARDPGRRRDLSTWLADMPAGCFPVGRLDRDTTGALLFTSDGDLANAVLQPDHATTKEYWLWLHAALAHDDPRLRALETGVPSALGLLRADSATVLASSAHYTEVLVTLSAGKNRQLRRMCAALQLPLLQLHRRSVGPITVSDLQPGEWRELGVAEIEQLWSATQGRALADRRKIAALRRLAKAAREGAEPLCRLERWLEARDSAGD